VVVAVYPDVDIERHSSRFFADFVSYPTFFGIICLDRGQCTVKGMNVCAQVGLE
jgi:hypothetical protein